MQVIFRITADELYRRDRQVTHGAGLTHRTGQSCVLGGSTQGSGQRISYKTLPDGPDSWRPPY